MCFEHDQFFSWQLHLGYQVGRVRQDHRCMQLEGDQQKLTPPFVFNKPSLEEVIYV